MSLGRLVNGVRRGDWGPPVKLTKARAGDVCSVCRGGIIEGDEVWIRAFVGTKSHRTCGEPSRTRMQYVSVEPAPAPTCMCGRCFACNMRELEAEGYKL